MENLYKDKESGAENELVDKRPLTEWIVENYMNFGAKLESAHLCADMFRAFCLQRLQFSKPRTLAEILSPVHLPFTT